MRNKSRTPCKGVGVNPQPATIVGLLKTLRGLGYSHRTLGEYLGVAEKTVYRWEHGLSRPTQKTVDTLQRIADNPPKRNTDGVRWGPSALVDLLTQTFGIGS